MNRFILTSTIALALTGAVLAAPIAPAPREKFIAPKITNTFEALVFTTQRPVRIRITTFMEGKSVDELWRSRMKKLFDYCDRDNDGTLSEKELKLSFTDMGLSQLLANGYYQPTPNGAMKLSELDKNGDGKLSFEEFLAAYSRTMAQVVRAYPAQPDYTNNTVVTEAIYKLLDANEDGKLTKDEVKVVEKLLASLDADEDECLNIQELVPELYNPGGGRRPGRARPQPNVAPQPGSAGTVQVYDVNRVPGTLTQVVIKKYDKDGDFELTKEEIGFDDATFKALDENGDGKLTGEEFDAWRTGAPDLDLTLSVGPKNTDCVAKLSDEKAAAARGFKLKQAESGRLYLHVGRQSVELGAFAPMPQTTQPSLKQQYAYLFTQAAAGKDHILEKDLTGPNAVQYQFIRVLFEGADRDGDGKLTKAEYDGYFDLQDNFRNVSLGISTTIQTPSLFQLLDENRDGRLSVRELRTAWNRLIALEESGAEVITRNIIQPTVSVRLSRALDRYFVTQQIQVDANFNYIGMNQNQVNGPSKGPMWFRKMDRNGDGDVSRSEFIGTKAEFDAIDTDHDDLISLKESEEWDSKTRVKEVTPAPAPQEKEDRKEKEKEK